MSLQNPTPDRDWHPVPLEIEQEDLLASLEGMRPVKLMAGPKAERPVLVVDTRDGRWILTSIQDLPSRYRDDLPYEFLTAAQVVARLLEWRRNGFKWAVEADVFKYVRVFRTDKGFLWCSRTSRHLPGPALRQMLMQNWAQYGYSEPKEKVYEA